MMTESTGMERSGRDRGSAERGEPVADLPTVDVCDRASREARQDLVAQVAPVHLERSRLPDPLVALEHDLGGGLEEGLAGVTRRILSLPDRCQHRAGAAPRLTDAHGVGIPDDLPDALAAMLAVDEEALAARGQDADAEAGELAVAGAPRASRATSCSTSSPGSASRRRRRRSRRPRVCNFVTSRRRLSALRQPEGGRSWSAMMCWR